MGELVPRLKSWETYECVCHDVGKNAIHIVPCCDRPYAFKWKEELVSHYTVLRIPPNEPKKPKTN